MNITKLLTATLLVSTMSNAISSNRNETNNEKASDNTCQTSLNASSYALDNQLKMHQTCPCAIPHNSISDKQVNGCYTRKGALDIATNGLHCTYYRQSGKLCQETPYVNGLIDGIVRRFEYSFDGNTSYSEVPYSNDKKNGIARYNISEDGLFSSEVPFSNGLIDGVVKEYFPNGKVRTEVLYERGNELGIVRAFDNKGNDITDTYCIESPTRCIPVKRHSARINLEQRRKESGIILGPAVIDALEWVAYIKHYEAEQIVFISQKGCPVEWQVKDAKNAKVFLPGPQMQIPACWYASDDIDDQGDAIIVVCRRDLKSMGNACNRYSQRFFMKTETFEQ